MADEGTQSNGDGILADQGSQEFGAVIEMGNGAATNTGAGQTQEGQTQQTQQTQQTTQGQQTQQGQPGQQQQVTPGAPDLSAIIKSTVDATAAALSQRSGQQQTQQTQEQALSPQEFDRRYGIIRPTEQMLTAIIGQDPKAAVQTLDNLFQANLTAALKMSNDLVEAKLRQLDSKYEPHMKSWQSHQQEIQNKAAEDRFFKVHPDLANERELVMEMKDAFITKVQSGQVRFSNEQEAFNAVATATKAILQKVGGGQRGQGTTQTGQSQQTQQHTSNRQMAAASTAGRTGTGQATTKKDVVEEVFGTDAR